MTSMLARFQSSGFFTSGSPKRLVYAAPVDSEEALQNSIVYACQTISNYGDIFVRMRWSMIRLVEACIEFHEGHFEHLKCTVSATTQKLDAFGHVLIWLFFFLLLVFGTRVQISAPFRYSLYS
jgi:hypothetical protein